VGRGGVESALVAGEEDFRECAKIVTGIKASRSWDKNVTLLCDTLCLIYMQINYYSPLVRLLEINFSRPLVSLHLKLCGSSHSNSGWQCPRKYVFAFLTELLYLHYYRTLLNRFCSLRPVYCLFIYGIFTHITSNTLSIHTFYDKKKG
jgi:hypothetical protein